MYDWRYHIGVPACRNVLKGVKDFSIVADLTDETLLATKAAAVHMRGGKLDHLSQERSQLSFNNLEWENNIEWTPRNNQKALKDWDNIYYYRNAAICCWLKQ